MRFSKFIICVLLQLNTTVALQAFVDNGDSLAVIESLMAEEFQELEVNRVPTGLLYDKAYTPVDYRKFNGTISANNRSDISSFFLVLQGINSSVINSYADTINTGALFSAMSGCFNTNNRVPIGIAAFKYSYIAEDALTAGKLVYQEGPVEYLEDVYTPGGEWVNPYAESHVLTFSPYVNVVPQSVTYDFSALFSFTNLSIASMAFDAGDGMGYRTVSSNQTLAIQYSTLSIKQLKLRVVLSNDEVLLAHSVVDVISSSQPSTPADGVLRDVETFTGTIASDGVYPKATICIHYANGQSFSRQPLIIAEGFDPISNINLFSRDAGELRGHGSTTIYSFLDEESPIITEYDVVYIDWQNSTCSIESNANILQQVIAWVNQRKPVNKSNVLMGVSMGGLIARYALRQMELAGIPHSVSTYVSLDSPHLGVNVPLGYLYAARELFDVLNNPAIQLSADIVSFIAGGAFQSSYSELMRLQDGTSVKQMVRYYLNSSRQIETTAYDAFQQTLHSLGLPQGDPGKEIRNICISNGGENDFYAQGPLLNICFWHGAGPVFTDPAYILHALLTGDLSLLPFVGSHTSIKRQFRISPLVSAGAEVYYFKESIVKEYAWRSSLSITLRENVYYAPQTLMPQDDVYGSIYDALKNCDLSLAHSSYIANFGVDFTYHNQFVFVPTVSSLCYKNGQSITAAEYKQDFYNTGVDIDKTPFDGYIFHDSDASYHTSFGDDDMTKVQQMDSLSINSTVPSSGLVHYSLNDSSLSVVWSSSNPNVITINANTGQATVAGYGSALVYATISIPGGTIRLKTEFNNAPPPSITFPNYILKVDDETLDTEFFYNMFSVRALTAAPIAPDLMPFVKYCWGQIPAGSSNIVWSETTSTQYGVVLAPLDDRAVYFRVRYLDTYSTTYSVICPFHSNMIPVDPLGNLYTEDLNEVIAQVKGDASSSFYIIRCLGLEVEFDQMPSLAILCRRLLMFDSFINEVKTLRPWGQEVRVIIPYSIELEGVEERLERVMIFEYCPDINPQ